MRFRFRSLLPVAAFTLSCAEALVTGCSGSDPASGPVDAGTAHDATNDSPIVADASPADAARIDGGGDATDARDAAPNDASAVDEAAVVYTPDGSLWVNHDATCGFGEIGATFLGVPAYCQPSSANGYYQCDELANRFVRDALHHPELDNVVTDFASTICGHVANNPAYSVWGSAYRPTAGHRPVPGDLVVYNGSPGHVAVITGFFDPNLLKIMQQNGGPSVALESWDTDASFIGNTAAECWIHPEPAPVATLPTMPSCGCFDNGDTCGLAIVDHEWWYACTAQVPDGGVAYNSLYTCDGGVFEKKEDCSSLCITPDLYDAGGGCGQ